MINYHTDIGGLSILCKKVQEYKLGSSVDLDEFNGVPCNLGVKKVSTELKNKGSNFSFNGLFLSVDLCSSCTCFAIIFLR